MFCKNCGNQMDSKASFCVQCGVAAGTGSAFCQNCGQGVTADAQVCIHCGHTLYGAYGPGGYGAPRYNNYNGAYPMQKSRIAAGVLAILVGALGIHNFYLGHNARGVTQLLISVLTCGIGAVPMEIWAIVEGVMLLCGSVNTDANGIPLRD